MCHNKPSSSETTNTHTDHHLLRVFTKLIRCIERLTQAIIIQKGCYQLFSTNCVRSLCRQIPGSIYGCLQLVRDQLPLELILEALALILSKDDCDSQPSVGGSEKKKGPNIQILQIKYMTQTVMEEQGSNANMSSKGRCCSRRAMLSCPPLLQKHQSRQAELLRHCHMK